MISIGLTGGFYPQILPGTIGVLILKIVMPCITGIGISNILSTITTRACFSMTSYMGTRWCRAVIRNRTRTITSRTLKYPYTVNLSVNSIWGGVCTQLCNIYPVPASTRRPTSSYFVPSTFMITTIVAILVNTSATVNTMYDNVVISVLIRYIVSRIFVSFPCQITTRNLMIAAQQSLLRCVIYCM